MMESDNNLRLSYPNKNDFIDNDFPTFATDFYFILFIRTFYRRVSCLEKSSNILKTIQFNFLDADSLERLTEK